MKKILSYILILLISGFFSSFNESFCVQEQKSSNRVFAIEKRYVYTNPKLEGISIIKRVEREASDSDDPVLASTNLPLYWKGHLYSSSDADAYMGKTFVTERLDFRISANTSVVCYDNNQNYVSAWGASVSIDLDIVPDNPPNNSNPNIDFGIHRGSFAESFSLLGGGIDNNYDPLVFIDYCKAASGATRSYSPTSIQYSSEGSMKPSIGDTSDVSSTISGDLLVTKIPVDIDGNVDEEDNEPGELKGELEDSGSTTTTRIADSATRTLSPGSTSYTYATVGSTHYSSLTSSVPYKSIVWQVLRPGHTGNIIPVVETDNGDGSLTDATLSYSFPSDVTGTYKIMAYVWYSDTSGSQMSYDVRVTLEPGLRPINGSSYYANGGDTYEMGLVTNAPYSRVEWYMKPAGDTSPNGANVDTDYAVGTTTEAELSYALPKGTPGHCTITAHVFNTDGSDYKITYDVYVY